MRYAICYGRHPNLLLIRQSSCHNQILRLIILEILIISLGGVEHSIISNPHL